MSFVRVGILHSLSGTMAISEASLVEAVLMAIAEINQAGGVLGKSVEPVIEDGASDPAFFEFKARKLIEQDRVNTIFGCWTSAARKAVLPVLEESDALLWYPVQYEGLECSQHIFYTGSCPNQQVEPAVTWLLHNKGTRFYLLGSDYVFPRTVNKIIKAQLKYQGGTVVSEEYASLGTTEFAETITRIKQARPDVVFNTLNGDSNIAFYNQFRESGITAAEIPILAVSVAEAEVQRIGDAAVGHYASWSYFQSLDTPSNKRFVQNFQGRYGGDRVTSDPIEAAYTQVYLWKQAVEQAQSFEVERVRVAAYGQSFEAPSGLVRIEPNHHIWKPCRIGKILPTGQFEVVFTSDNPIKPLPWLGVEEVSFKTSNVVIDMLAEVSQGIHGAWQLEQKSRELKAAKVELQREITQRQRVEAVLRDSEAQLHALFAAMTDLVLVIDARGQYLKIAPTNLELLYKPVDELIGKTLHDVFPHQQADLLISYIRKALDTKQTVNVEYSRQTIRNKEVWLAASISPISEDSVIWVVRDLTERKRSEEALRQSEERMRALLNAIPDRMFRHRVDGTYLDVKASEGDLIVPSETLIGKNLHDIPMPQEVKQRLLELIQITVETGELQTYEHELQKADEVKSYEARIVKSGVDEAVCIVRDITERKQAEEALRKAEERYHSIFQNSDKGLFQRKPDGRYLSANPALARIYGYKSPDELIAASSNINLPRYVESNRRAEFLALMQAEDKVESFDSQTYCQNDSIIWISENAHVVRDADGEVLYHEGSVVDITVRKVWEEALRYQQECTEELLLNILPSPIAQRLKLAESTIADSFAEVTVLFADLVDFTEFSARVHPTQLVELLNKIFSQFDRLAEKHGLEKIKTIGDAYMVVGGLPTPKPDHPEAIAEMALDMQQEITRFKRDNGEPMNLRIGINTGPVVAGVIGMKKFTYDLWGDTVNVASRMESQGVAGGIQVTAATYERLKDKYLFEERGATFVKGKGEMITYWLIGRKVDQIGH
jgi:urea transport system substrate-binding protein